jgi:hypothetical protein
MWYDIHTQKHTHIITYSFIVHANMHIWADENNAVNDMQKSSGK